MPKLTFAQSERRDDRADQHHRRAGLGAEEVADRRRQVARPGGPPAVRAVAPASPGFPLGVLSHAEVCSPGETGDLRPRTFRAEERGAGGDRRAARLLARAGGLRTAADGALRRLRLGRLLVFVDFGGTPADPPRSPTAALALACAATIAARHALLPHHLARGRGDALVGFAILFAGVIDGYVAAASLVLILTFVIAAMVPAERRRNPRPAGGVGPGGAALDGRDLRPLAEPPARPAAARDGGGARRAGGLLEAMAAARAAAGRRRGRGGTRRRSSPPTPTTRLSPPATPSSRCRTARAGPAVAPRPSDG